MIRVDFQYGLVISYIALGDFAKELTDKDWCDLANEIKSSLVNNVPSVFTESESYVLIELKNKIVSKISTYSFDYADVKRGKPLNTSGIYEFEWAKPLKDNSSKNQRYSATKA